MRCRPELLSALLDGELGTRMALRVRRHLVGCTSCQQELLGLKALQQALQDASPFPPRAPIRRPIGIVRPALATLALASGALLLVRLQPGPATVLPKPTTASVASAIAQQAPVAPPHVPKALAPPKQVALSTQKTTVRERRGTLRSKRVSRRTPRRRRQHFAEAAPEQIIVMATRRTPPEPVTVVLNDKDDEGGTIHIESTIPAAYVVALQKEKL